jgi:tripartite-type tricarboxylate transporter receptor subunit TctC
MVQALQSETVRQRLTSVGFVVPALGSKPYTGFVKSEIDTWTRVIQTAGIKPQ